MARLVEQCKCEHANLLFCESIRVEWSKKVYKDGRIEKERYTVPILYSEFRAYRQSWQRKLLSAVNFNMDDLGTMLAEIANPRYLDGADIIFGLDGQKGKL